MSLRPAVFVPETSPSLQANLWPALQRAAREAERKAPFLQTMISFIVTQSETMTQALARTLARQNTDAFLSPDRLAALFLSVLSEQPALVEAASADIQAILARDPAATDPLTPFLYFKGFLALQTHRIAHALWLTAQEETAFYLQSRSSALYGVDMHPAAQIDQGILMDHATGIVIGETAVVEKDVTLLHNVTLGGTGKERGDRHPKVRRGATVGAGAKILGNVEIGAFATIAAGSVVLQNIPAHATAAGVPARLVAKTNGPKTL